MRGRSSITLYMISLIIKIGSSHSNHSVSNRGKFIHVTGLPSQNDKSLLNSISVILSVLLFSGDSWMELLCQYENDMSHIHVMVNIDIIFFNFIVGFL